LYGGEDNRGSPPDPCVSSTRNRKERKTKKRGRRGKMLVNGVGRERGKLKNMSTAPSYRKSRRGEKKKREARG